MPRYIVQRTFPEGLEIPLSNGWAEVCATVVEHNTAEGVTWVHCYVSEDKRTTFCVYDAPAPEAIRKTAARNELLIDQITQVRVLDPISTTGVMPESAPRLLTVDRGRATFDLIVAAHRP